jgi:hypothetical protein
MSIKFKHAIIFYKIFINKKIFKYFYKWNYEIEILLSIHLFYLNNLFNKKLFP